MGVQLIVLITRWEVVDDLDVTLALRLDLLVQHKEAGILPVGAVGSRALSNDLISIPNT